MSSRGPLGSDNGNTALPLTNDGLHASLVSNGRSHLFVLGEKLAGCDADDHYGAVVLFLATNSTRQSGERGELPSDNVCRRTRDSLWS